MKVLIILIFLLFANSYGFLGIGDRLEHTYMLFKDLPLTLEEAISDDWIPLNDGNCDPNIGIAYFNPQSPNQNPNTDHPIVLYFTAAGQISGVGVVHVGRPAQGLGQYWQNEDNMYILKISFRSSSASETLCSNNTQFQEALGTQVVINQGSLNLALPLTKSEAINSLWTNGSCLPKMGQHWSYDLAFAPDLSFKGQNLMPVTVMYNLDTNKISAFFFSTPRAQVSLLTPWEGPFTSTIMCQNWCDTNCYSKIDNPLLGLWSTLHFFLTDVNLNVCGARCPNLLI